MKLEEQRRARENQALTKASSPAKTAGTEPTPSNKTCTSTTISEKANERREKERGTAQEEKKEGDKKGNKFKAKNKQKLWRFHQMKTRTLSSKIMRLRRKILREAQGQVE